MTKNVVEFATSFVSDHKWLVEGLATIFTDMNEFVLERLVGNIHILDLNERVTKDDIKTWLLTHYSTEGTH